MDIYIKDIKQQFIFRTSALILNKDKSKVLLFNVERKSIYLLPGGKVQFGENSLDAITRELNEELNLDMDKMDFSYLGLSEEFVKDSNDYLSQHINIIYKVIYNGEVLETRFKGKEGSWINFEWIDIDKLDNYRLHPRNIKEMTLNLDKTYHIIEDLRD